MQVLTVDCHVCYFVNVLDCYTDLFVHEVKTLQQGGIIGIVKLSVTR